MLQQEKAKSLAFIVEISMIIFHREYFAFRNLHDHAISWITWIGISEFFLETSNAYLTDFFKDVALHLKE